MGPLFAFLSWMKISSIVCFSVSSFHLEKKNAEPPNFILASLINPDNGEDQKEQDNPSSGASPVSCSSPVVSCWDNCFDDATLTSMDSAGKVRSHGFTTVFDRYDESASPPRSILESAIVFLLEQMENGLPTQQPQQDIRNNMTDKDDDDTPQSPETWNPPPPQHHRYVEYWWRDPTSKPRMLEVHRDVDEELCRQVQYPVELGASQKMGKQRCPTFGHVLYVNIDLPDPKFQAPTLVWEEESPPPERGGGGPPRYPLSNVWVVPAVTNRLLRFRGDCLHAVCYPPLEFLQDWVEPPQDVVVAKPKKQEHTNNNDPSDHPPCQQQQQRRAVLLFNTWEEPPLYPPVGEALSLSENNLGKDFSSSTTMPQTHNLRTPFQFPVQPIKVVVPNKDEGEQPQLSPPLVKLSVPLLGGMDRRGCPETHLESFVDPRMAEKALTSPKDVYCLPLYDDKDEE